MAKTESGCDNCESIEEHVNTYLVHDKSTGEERPMKLCSVCFGRAEQIGIEIISPPLPQQG